MHRVHMAKLKTRKKIFYLANVIAQKTRIKIYESSKYAANVEVKKLESWWLHTACESY